MVKPLSFKGDTRAKKRKRAPDADKSSTATNTKLDKDDDDDSWVSADTEADVGGPVMLVLPTEPVTCLACDANGKIYASKVDNLIEGQASTAEPHDVRQVWVTSRVAGTGKIGFKGHHGRYLGSDKVGLLSATREAVSFEESFEAIPVPDQPGCFAIQTARETFISADDSSLATSPSGPDIRADSDKIDFKSTLRVRMQARFKPKLKVAKAEKAREKISRKELEELVGRRLDDGDVKMLKRARRDGGFHEALLDVKVKGKHDKYA